MGEGLNVAQRCRAEAQRAMDTARQKEEKVRAEFERPGRSAYADAGVAELAWRAAKRECMACYADVPIPSGHLTQIEVAGIMRGFTRAANEDGFDVLSVIPVEPGLLRIKIAWDKDPEPGDA